MRDALGNKISDGDLVRWAIPEGLLDHLLFQVLKVSDGGILTPQGETPPFIVLSVTVPINRAPGAPAGEPTLGDFLCLRNPGSEKIIDILTGTKAGKPS